MGGGGGREKNSKTGGKESKRWIERDGGIKWRKLMMERTRETNIINRER